MVFIRNGDNMSFRTIVIAPAGRNKKIRALSIVNPVAGSSGIYNVVDDAGNTFPAYVEMSIDGGYWILVSRWTGYISTSVPANKISFRKSIQKDQAISGYSVSPSMYPAIPAGRIAKNPANEWLMVSANTTWIGLFGAWQKGAILTGDIGPTQAIPVVTSIGNRNLYGARAGWSQVTTMDSGLGFWTQAGNSGPCGGAARLGTSKPCPVMAYTTEGYENHSDATSVKSVYIRAVNYPG